MCRWLNITQNIAFSFYYPPRSPTWVIRHRTALCAELLLPNCIDPLQTAVPRFCLLQLLLPDCVRFSCCSPLASASTALPRFQQLPDCIRFGFFSPIASASTVAPWLRPLQLQLPDCIRFDCCSLIASTCSLTCSERFQPMPNVLCGVRGSANWSTKVARH